MGRQAPAHPLATAVTEDIRALAAVGAGEGAHVLDDPKNLDLHLLEHPQAPAGDLEAHGLWCRYDHHPRQRHALCQRQLGVAGTGREVEDQVVQRSPLHAVDEHLQVLSHHRPAQDGWFVVCGEHAHRHHLQAVPLRRDHLAVRGHRWRLTGWDAKHAGDTGAKDVGIHDPDARPELLQGERQIDAHRGFSDAPLPLPTAMIWRIPGSFSAPTADWDDAPGACC